MKRKLLVLITCITLMTPGILPVGQAGPKSFAQEPPAQSNAPQYGTQDQSRPVRRYYSSRERRSYERETHTRHHYHITKGEVVVLATVAAMPLGIGAIAAGGRGLAIGAIIAGPSTVAAHYIWKHFHS
jgi:hypothetical protein